VGPASSGNTHVLEAWRTIGQLAPGSYGLLYVHDDEDAGRDNSWVVYTMTRGMVAERSDTWLSPVVPVLQDPEPDLA
jgi:hypothetical protein